MAHKVHIGQQFGDFLTFETAIKKYQDAENVQFFKRDSRSLKAAKGRVSNKNFNEALKFYEVSYHCIRGGKNFKPRGTGKKVTRDNALSMEELSDLLEDLFCTNSHSLSEDMAQKIFSLLDEDKDGKLSENDFRRCGYYWLKQTLKPISALVVVDVQNDFIVGSLNLQSCPAGQDGSEVIPVINSLLDTAPFDLVVYSKDWHPENHISFIDNVKSRPITDRCKIKADTAKVMDTVEFDLSTETEQRLWPKHCVQESWGSELHPDLKVTEDSVVVYKGCQPEVDSYSAFWDNNKMSQTELVSILAKHRVTDVFLCGVAYDVCVGYTAFHSLEHGFKTILIEDACRGVDSAAMKETRDKLTALGGLVVNSSKVKGMVNGEDRPPVLGLQSAKNVALARELVNRGMVK